MKNLKHFYWIIIFFIIFLSLHGTVLAADTTTIRVSVPTSMVYSGQQFAVSIEVNPNNAIAGAQFSISFDTSLVTVNSVVEGNLFKDSGANSYFIAGRIDNTAGTVKNIAGAIITPGRTVATAGTLAIINMTANTTAGTCPFTLSNVIIGDSNAKALATSIVNGQVIITDMRTYPTSNLPVKPIVGESTHISSSGAENVMIPIKPLDTIPPLISNIIVDEITTNSTNIQWATNEESTGKVVSKEVTTPNSFSLLDDAEVTNHRIALSNLEVESKYYYMVLSTAGSGNLFDNIDHRTSGGINSRSYSSDIGLYNNNSLVDPNSPLLNTHANRPIIVGWNLFACILGIVISSCIMTIIVVFKRRFQLIYTWTENFAD